MKNINLNVVYNGIVGHVSASSGTSLLEALRDAGYRINALCGERGVCGSCAVRLTGGDLAPSDADRSYFTDAQIKAGWRLSCAAYPSSDISVLIQDGDEDGFAGVVSFQQSGEESNAVEVARVRITGGKDSFAKQIAVGDRLRLSLLQEAARLIMAPASELESDSYPESDPQPASESEPSSEAVSGAGSGSEASSASEPSPKAEPGPEPEPCLEPGPEPETSPEPELGQNSEADKSLYVAKYDDSIVRISRAREKLYAIGADIGTTTIGMVLVDLSASKVVGSLSFVNKQREYGADVISRIVKAKQGGPALLSGIVRKQVEEGINRLCQDYNVPIESIVRVGVAGNTTMLHLFWGLSCDTLGSFPFTPVTLDWVRARYNEVFSCDLDCDVIGLPGISTYIGADIAAGLLYLGARGKDAPCVLLDIGTNGEMALTGKSGILCSSTAAGPALEGVNISWGTGSVPGAISSVSYGASGFEVRTIGERPPIGVCGSGVIDSAYCFLRHGVIDKSGRFAEGYDPGGVEIAKTSGGESVSICQKDIREIQLAKSAVRAGLEILIKKAGLSYGDIEELYIAGGFGYNINYRSAVGIGLIPAELDGKIKTVGNSALGGIVAYLTDPGKKLELDAIINESNEFSLSEYDGFYDLFIEYMSF